MASQVLKGSQCPLCKGGKVIWGRCCSGLAEQCGCMGLPVPVDCYLCKHTGVIEEDILDLNIDEDIEDQQRIQQWMEETYPDHFEQ